MKLKVARQLRLMSARELAAKAGVSDATIFSIERGASKVKRMETARKISQALNLPAQMIDEFRAVAGASLLSEIPSAEWAQITARLDTVDENNTVPLDSMIDEIERERAAKRMPEPA